MRNLNFETYHLLLELLDFFLGKERGEAGQVGLMSVVFVTSVWK